MKYSQILLALAVVANALPTAKEVDANINIREAGSGAGPDIDAKFSITNYETWKNGARDVDNNKADVDRKYKPSIASGWKKGGKREVENDADAHTNSRDPPRPRPPLGFPPGFIGVEVPP
ncbi:hypothetical protein FQN57_005873 [Myotisia sp. PD_48]|nr:hypothetical protein FQN57_005873 [Myotisia sp. PD_48]